MSLLFLLMPESVIQQHLDILAELAKLMADKILRQALETEIDPFVVRRILITGEP